MRRFVIVYTLLFMLLGAGTLFDLPINQFLYHPQSGFGWFMEHVYVLIMIGILPVAFIMLMSVKPNPGTVLLGILTCLYMAREISFYLLPAYKYDQQLLLAGILFISLTLIMRLLPKSLRRALLPFLLFMCFVLIGASVLVEILKNLWGRVRFRSPHGLQLFTPWYLPQGINGNKSFPSGHTTAASITLCLLALPQFYHRPIPVWITAVAFLSPLLMAVSRMIMGAHYLSDTTFAFLIVYTIVELLIYIRKKRNLTG